MSSAVKTPELSSSIDWNRLCKLSKTAASPIPDFTSMYLRNSNSVIVPSPSVSISKRPYSKQENDERDGERRGERKDNDEKRSICII